MDDNLLAAKILALRSPALHSPLATRTMSNKADAAAKDAEGKLESALGELTGDTGHQIKGKAKQVQASAMNAAEDLKDGAKAVAQKVSDAAAKLADG
ncbi:CsbD family protein [Cyanobium gracile]|nr:CsbD family protein [Cyanobium gracile]